MSSRAAAFLGVLASALGTAGCHNCMDDEQVRMNFELAEYMYGNTKFDESTKYYRRALELCDDNYRALVGLGNASREYGNQLFLGADELFKQNKGEHANKMLRQAQDNHFLSLQCLETARKLKPEDPLPRYGLALLWYERATSPIDHPLRLNDPNRGSERDRAIQEFKTLLGQFKDADKLYSAHRYLGLALFAAGRMNEGRDELRIFHDFMQRVYTETEAMRTRGPDQERNKLDALSRIEKEIEDVRDVLLMYQGDIEEKSQALRAKGASLTAEEAQALARLRTESLVLQGMIGEFVATRLGPVEREVKDRCARFLQCFNGGSPGEALSFIAIPPGQDSRVRRALQERVDLGLKYQNVSYKRVSVAADSGEVTFMCEQVGRDGSKPRVEVTTRWKLVAGQWLLAELP